MNVYVQLSCSLLSPLLLKLLDKNALRAIRARVSGLTYTRRLFELTIDQLPFSLLPQDEFVLEEGGERERDGDELVEKRLGMKLYYGGDTRWRYSKDESE